MKSPINVSKGQKIDFEAAKVPKSGIIVKSEMLRGSIRRMAIVEVLIDSLIPKDALLTIPSFPEIGGCGKAEPRDKKKGISIVLIIPCSHIDESTIGK